MRRGVWPAAILIAVTSLAVSPAAEEERPTKRLTFGGSVRARLSRLWNQFRPGLDENDQAFSLRTLLRTEVTLPRLSLVAEFQDSRAYLTDENSAVSTIVVNAAGLLQGYVGTRLNDVFTEGATLDLRLGRQTIDLGGRRLVARNRFRNTIQNYSGLTAHWRGNDQSDWFAFFVLPVLVRPDNLDRAGLLDNDIASDEEDFDLRFWGASYRRPLGRGSIGELYLFGLEEDDDPGELETRNRRLYTPGLRWLRPPGARRWDFDVETTVQFGTRRATPLPADVEPLDVRALFQHGTIGYTFDEPWSPRLGAEWDYATGEADSSDGEWGRFDTLFGPRRTEFGPTGIYGILGRENIVSVGPRLTLSPGSRLDGFVSWRANWLDERSDFFARSLVRDPSGESGGFAGHQLELRGRYWWVPSTLCWEIGAALFLEGRFM
ncbi:MAG TPA: alginate export family protein, partial [Candidatus Polarisedimenticolaceae bacterium]|nr:alginate export family protein [Candidatus Polarisedimenticolaceae bacterium]